MLSDNSKKAVSAASGHVVSRRTALGVAASLSLAAFAPVAAHAEEAFEEVELDATSIRADALPAESWRFSNGVPIELDEPDEGIALAAIFEKWGKNEAGEWVNSVGDPISGALLRGVDVSSFQRTVDWSAVKSNDVNFALIRAAAWTGKDCKGEEGFDNYWGRNASECERLGIPYGAYIYSYATSVSDAVFEADYLLSLMKGRKPSYPLYIDLEDTRIANANLNAIAAAFCERIESRGYQAGIYANLSWWNNKLTDPKLGSWSPWVAQYNVTCDYAGQKDLWQATSKGTVAGIAGNVDINFDYVGLDGKMGAQTTWKRLYGARHLETMQAIAQHGWAACDSVVVATNVSYHDALSASALAGALGCPVLVTAPQSLSDQTSAEVRRLGAKTAYVVGGTNAVRSEVDAQLKAAGCQRVERVAGANGQDTAVKIARRVRGLGSASSTCVIATAETFQDALSVSPYAYWAKSPIFLCEFGSNQLSSATLSAIRELGFSSAAIVGGPAAVSSAVEEQLRASTEVKIVARLQGSHCYETSVAVAEWSLKQGMGCGSLGVATGLEHYDALCGAALCGKQGSPLVLVSDVNRTSLSSFIPQHKGEVNEGYVFGGPAAVSETTWLRLLRNYLY